MNLFEMLDNYQTNPNNEMRKIWNILNERPVDITLWDELDYFFRKSEFSCHESSLKTFYHSYIYKNEILNDYEPFEAETLQYRLFCELLLNITQYSSDRHFYGELDSIIEHLNSVIENGLNKCGYGMKQSGDHYVTFKKDLVSETVAAQNKDYSDDIYDYLIAKTIKEKEKALTQLSIKLEKLETKDGFMKNAKDYLQMMRHKDERKDIPRYAWFYESKSYEENLEKLFKILVCYLSHYNCSSIINQFDMQCHFKN